MNWHSHFLCVNQALYQKGISNKDSEAAIKLVFEKGQCREGDEEPETKHGLSKEAVDQLYVQASKRWHQGRDLPIENRKARVIRWLQYRGFNWGVVSQLLKRLESHQSWVCMRLMIIFFTFIILAPRFFCLFGIPLESLCLSGIWLPICKISNFTEWLSLMYRYRYRYSSSMKLFTFAYRFANSLFSFLNSNVRDIRSF